MKIRNKMEELTKAMKHVEEGLEKYKLGRREQTMNMLLAEEAIVCLMQHTDAEAELEIFFQKRFGTVRLVVRAPGEEFNFAEESPVMEEIGLEEMEEGMEQAIRGLIFRSQRESVWYKNHRHQNVVEIVVKRQERMQLYLTLGAVGLSIVLGILFQIFLPDPVRTGIDHYILNPVKTMFLNALKIVVGPVVFFSIVSCLSQFDSIRDLGKIGAKIMGMYLFTTLVAVLVGFGAFFLIQPGDSSFASSVTDAASETIAAAGQTNISILDTVVNIVPANLVKPFLEGDMLQIIFLAILCGVAVGMIGDYSKPLKQFFEACNQLFLKVTSLIVKVIPLAVLCSMTSLVMSTGADTLLSILGFMGTFLLGLVGMTGIYCLLVLVIGRLNPVFLLKKHGPTMLTNFSLASSSASMPFNIRSCQNMGISSRLCSFSIPLGATVNMDGSCVYMAVAGLFLAKVFGVELDMASYTSMIFSIIVLSIGAPGIPGSGLVCLSVLLTQLGIPAEAISLVMGVDSLLGMFRTAVNSTGDVAVSLIVAKKEKMLDEDMYSSRS